MQVFQTFGEMLDKHPDFAERKRNRPGDYGRTSKRDWLRNEIKILFRRQRELDSKIAMPELEKQFVDEAFYQRPLQDAEHLVRYCSFEVGEKRTSKHAPSFERFRLLQKLVHTRLWASGERDRPFTSDEIAKIEQQFSNQAKFTYKTIRKILDLAPSVRFRGVPEKGERQDVATSSKDGSSRGIRELRKVLGPETYDRLGEEILDNVMFFIAFRESIESIQQGLRTLSLPEDIISRLIEAVGAGNFIFATGAAHISAKACRAICTGLRDGLVYSDACQQAGYDHSSPGAEALAQVPRPATRKDLVAIFADPKVSPIASPVARKALIEAIKQVTAIINEHPALKGRLPGRVHIELARDVGKGPKERSEIDRGMKRRRSDIEKAETKFKELFQRTPRRGTMDLRIFDAIVLAATTESMVQLLTRAHQRAEELGGAREFDTMDQPWPVFRDDVKKALEGVYVSQAECRRARGSVHEETIRSIDSSGSLTLTRQTPADLLGKPKPDADVADVRKKLESRIPRPERSRAIIDELMRWHMAGQPAEISPLGPTGDPIGKIRAYTNKKSLVAVPIRKGSADRGKIIRTDVFQKPNKQARMQYFLVPVYPHQLLMPKPPMHAIQANKDEREWPEMSEAYQFLFSLWPLSLIRIVKPDGEIIIGYLRQVSRSTGAFSISDHRTLQPRLKRDGIGARDLQIIEKLHIDRLGRITPVSREVRTWHGEACT